MSFREHEKYKDSRFIWLGQIPDRWSTVRLCHVTDCLDGQRVPLNSSERAGRKGNVPYWGANCIVDHVDEAIFDEPLVLLGEDGAPFFEPTRSVAFLSEGPIWPNNHVHVLRPHIPDDAGFIVNALNITDYAQFIDGSTRDKLTQGQMGGIPLPWPSAEERKAIARFLDRETSKIDGLVAEQRRLIALLKEKRQAVISHAVTKGLNPGVPMKPSGIPWLGDVPEHWEILPLKYLADLRSGNGITANSIQPSGDYPVYGGNGLRGYTSCFTHDGHYVIIGRQGALCGNVNYAIGKFWASEHAVVASPRREYHTKWFGEMSRAMNLGQYSVTAAQPGLSMEAVGKIRTAVPPVHEQKRIAEYIQAQDNRMDALTEETERAISLFQERRTALISAAVTGKIDVRDQALQESA